MESQFSFEEIEKAIVELKDLPADHIEKKIAGMRSRVASIYKLIKEKEGQVAGVEQKLSEARSKLAVLQESYEKLRTERQNLLMAEDGEVNGKAVKTITESLHKNIEQRELVHDAVVALEKKLSSLTSEIPPMEEEAKKLESLIEIVSVLPLVRSYNDYAEKTAEALRDLLLIFWRNDRLWKIYSSSWRERLVIPKFYCAGDPDFAEAKRSWYDSAIAYQDYVNSVRGQS